MATTLIKSGRLPTLVNRAKTVACRVTTCCRELHFDRQDISTRRSIWESESPSQHHHQLPASPIPRAGAKSSLSTKRPNSVRDDDDEFYSYDETPRLTQVMSAKYAFSSNGTSMEATTTNATQYSPFRIVYEDYVNPLQVTACDYGTVNCCFDLLHHDDVCGVQEARRIWQSSSTPYYDDDPQH